MRAASSKSLLCLHRRSSLCRKKPKLGDAADSDGGWGGRADRYRHRIAGDLVSEISHL